MKNIVDLFFSRNFIILVVFVNFFIWLMALFFYFLEKGANEKLKSFMDALWFSFSTVTTVGYGDIIPHTFYGKILGMFMMLIGTAFFATFTAIFANSFLKNKMMVFKSDLRKMEEIEKNLDLDEEKIEKLVDNLKLLIDQLEKKSKK
jgi:voltage-gated potassium channel